MTVNYTGLKVVLISGGFDPVHVGHVRLIREAKALASRMRGSLVFVALNSDEWLMRKKGFVFMPWAERAEILRAMNVGVTPVDDSDGTVAEAIYRIKPRFFCNGGDREIANDVEHAACAAMGVEEVFGLGGPKVRSSSQLALQVNHHFEDVDPR